MIGQSKNEYILRHFGWIPLCIALTLLAVSQAFAQPSGGG